MNKLTGLDVAMQLIEILVDDEPCRLDHDRFCQTHYKESPCAVDQGRQLVKKWKLNRKLEA